MNVLHVRIARLALALVALAAPAFAAEHDDQPQERPTVLDLSVLDHVDVEPFTGSLLHEHEDLLIGDGDDTFRLTRTWASWGGSALDFEEPPPRTAPRAGRRSSPARRCTTSRWRRASTASPQRRGQRSDAPRATWPTSLPATL